jgi:hypothetical protein
MPARDELPPLVCWSNWIAPRANSVSRGATAAVSTSARIASITTSSTLSRGARGSHRRGASG